jgi:hypothetical protein
VIRINPTHCHRIPFRSLVAAERCLAFWKRWRPEEAKDMEILDCRKCVTYHIGTPPQVEAHNGCTHEHHSHDA